MGDSYRPDRRHRSYYDCDNPDSSRTPRGRSRYDEDYRRDAPRELSPTLNYEPSDDMNDYHNRPKVCHPQYNEYNRSDDLRYPQQMPRYFDGRTVAQVPEGCPPETGEMDVSPNESPLRLVLVRGLTANTNEALFAKGMEKFYEGYDSSQGGAEPKSLRRVLLIRERRSGQSMGYGFAEYTTTRNAQAAIAKVPQLKEAKMCTIRSNEISLNFPHLGVFPHASFGVPEFNNKFTVTMPNSHQLHKYRDERYYASELVVNSEPPKGTTTIPQNDKSGEKKSTKIGSKRGMEMLEGKTLEGKAKKIKGSGSGPQPYLQQLKKKQAELRGEPDNTAVESSEQPASGVNAVAATNTSAEATENEQTFAYDGEIIDKDGNASKVIGCYLCGSQFETSDKLLAHLEQSKLHAGHLKDKEVIYRGYARLKKAHIDREKTIRLPKTGSTNETTLSQTQSQQEGSVYRDRAAERRQEEVKTIGFSLKQASQKKKGGNMSGSSSDNEPSKPTYGKGMNMLQKKGWSEGEGLGAGGGITAPIDQSLYASGVGLGHESSKKGDAVEEASRMTRNDRGEFLEKTKELAKKRYEEMK